jgi:hypothetical protein
MWLNIKLGLGSISIYGFMTQNDLFYIHTLIPVKNEEKKHSISKTQNSVAILKKWLYPKRKKN